MAKCSKAEKLGRTKRPRVVCRKCGVRAGKKRQVCKPAKLR